RGGRSSAIAGRPRRARRWRWTPTTPARASGATIRFGWRNRGGPAMMEPAVGPVSRWCEDESVSPSRPPEASTCGAVLHGLEQGDPARDRAVRARARALGDLPAAVGAAGGDAELAGAVGGRRRDRAHPQPRGGGAGAVDG